MQTSSRQDGYVIPEHNTIVMRGPAIVGDRSITVAPPSGAGNADVNTEGWNVYTSGAGPVREFEVNFDLLYNLHLVKVYETEPEITIWLTHNLSDKHIIRLKGGIHMLSERIPVSIRGRVRGVIPPSAKLMLHLRVKKINDEATEVRGREVRVERPEGIGMVPLTSLTPKIDAPKIDVEFAFLQENMISKGDAYIDFETRNGGFKWISKQPKVIFGETMPWHFTEGQIPEIREKMEQFLEAQMALFMDNEKSGYKAPIDTPTERDKHVRILWYEADILAIPANKFANVPQSYLMRTQEEWHMSEPFLLQILKEALDRIPASAEEVEVAIDAQFAPARRNDATVLYETRLVEDVLREYMACIATRFKYTSDTIWEDGDNGVGFSKGIESFDNAANNRTLDCEDGARYINVHYWRLTHVRWNSPLLNKLGMFARHYVPMMMLSLVDAASLAASFGKGTSGRKHTHTRTVPTFTVGQYKKEYGKAPAHDFTVLIPVTDFETFIERRNGKGHPIPWIEAERANPPRFVSDLRILPCEATGHLRDVIPRHLYMPAQDRPAERARLLQSNRMNKILQENVPLLYTLFSPTFDQLHPDVLKSLTDTEYDRFTPFYGVIASGMTSALNENNISGGHFLVVDTTGGPKKTGRPVQDVPAEMFFLKDKHVAFEMLAPPPAIIEVISHEVLAHTEPTPIETIVDIAHSDIDGKAVISPQFLVGKDGSIKDTPHHALTHAKVSEYNQFSDKAHQKTFDAALRHSIVDISEHLTNTFADIDLHQDHVDISSLLTKAMSGPPVSERKPKDLHEAEALRIGQAMHAKRIRVYYNGATKSSVAQDSDAQVYYATLEPKVRRTRATLQFYCDKLDFTSDVAQSLVHIVTEIPEIEGFHIKEDVFNVDIYGNPMGVIYRITLYGSV